MIVRYLRGSIGSKTPSELFPRKNSAYFRAGVFEERSEHIDNWSADPDVQKVRIDDLGLNGIKTDLSTEQISLRNRADIEKLLKSLKHRHVYIDVTGLSHHVWAPLVRVSLELNFTH